MKKKRKVNFQKIFCFISFVFLLTCVLWYGGRTIYFYLQSEKDGESSVVTLIDSINKKKLTENNNDYYFYGNKVNNYLKYSNLTWRIIKITSNDELVLVLDSPIVNLAYGSDLLYDESYINMWLNNISNKENTGILENKLSNVNLINTITCNDKVDNIEKYSCKDTNDKYKIGIPSLTDYINTGATDSFMNNGYYTYLSNVNSDSEIWYITDKGKLNSSDGTDIFGIKPVITLPSNTPLISGDGSNKSPYIIEKDSSYFAAYVKLGNDIWRIYDVEDDAVNLILNNYILDSNKEEFTYKYSESNYYHNDTKSNTLAYYLNNTYLDNLSYKDKIDTGYYANYYYGYSNDYDYAEILKNKVDTKVSVPSLTDVILNNDLSGYFTNTGTGKSANKVYIINNNGTVTDVSTSSQNKIVPCISINKNLLKKGSGSIDDPYEME